MAVVFWEDNDANGDGWPVSTEYVQSYNLTKDGSPVPNDETRSCTIVDAAAGTVISVYQSSEANVEKDYAQINVTQKVTDPVDIGTFQTTKEYGGGTVKVTYTRGDSDELDGKVSYIKVTPPA